MNHCIFRSAESYIHNEEHGGVGIKSEMWDYLFFYPNNNVAYVSSSHRVEKLYFNFDLIARKGSIIEEKDPIIEFFVMENNTKYLFKAKLNWKDLSLELIHDDLKNKLNVEIERFYLLLNENDLKEFESNYGQIIKFTALCSAPGVISNKNLMIGSAVKVVLDDGDWYKIIVEGDIKKTGWVPKDSVRMWKL